MHKSKTLGLITYITIFLLTGCAEVSIKRDFYHNYHRLAYSLTEQELKGLQLYIAKDVLAQYESPDGVKSLLIQKETPGVVLEVGPNWLKVSFQAGGKGTIFLADDDKSVDRYWLATEVKDKDGYYRVSKLPVQILINDGNIYKIVYGADAFLLIDSDKLQELREKRKVIKGRSLD
jgi:hypothetical protein